MRPRHSQSLFTPQCGDRTALASHTGKNRPLEPDELAFMERLRDDEIDNDRKQRNLELEGAEEYRRVSPR